MLTRYETFPVIKTLRSGNFSTPTHGHNLRMRKKSDLLGRVPLLKRRKAETRSRGSARSDVLEREGTKALSDDRTPSPGSSSSVTRSGRNWRALPPFPTPDEVDVDGIVYEDGNVWESCLPPPNTAVQGKGILKKRREKKATGEGQTRKRKKFRRPNIRIMPDHHIRFYHCPVMLEKKSRLKTPRRRSDEEGMNTSPIFSRTTEPKAKQNVHTTQPPQPSNTSTTKSTPMNWKPKRGGNGSGTRSSEPLKGRRKPGSGNEKATWTGPAAGPTAGLSAGPTAGPTAGPSAGPTAGSTARPNTGPTARPTAGPATATRPTAGSTARPTSGSTARPTSGPNTQSFAPFVTFPVCGSVPWCGVYYSPYYSPLCLPNSLRVFTYHV